MTLDEIRSEIDGIDTQMKTLFQKRMEMSKQVAKTKAVTGGDVYVAEREAEIIKKRTEGMEEEIYKPYVAFLKHIMGVSRTFQYSQLDGMQNKYLSQIPKGQGTLDMTFICNPGGLYPSLYALELSGLDLGEILVKQAKDGRLSCHLKLAGDFSGMEARGAILQVVKENQEVQII